ncbi:ABC transporter [Marinomonas sp. SBI22]|uniref:ABC transporter ATP-binding protein n=1 Tax=unclassified Marinomonas TaxID=196814 RepID=UPI0007AF1DAA|nr:MULTISPECIES: ABC transporter ATP-binding protein [unclassified Marinomonas]KZM39812.1 ABC transporter [Marinomonas sp. SBI22]KZM41188.1 ABC transporter [Marinomonas sp. SBI8L]
MFELNNIKVERASRTILSIPHLSLPSDQVCVVLGHNGSGKTTLIQSLANQLVPDQGEVLLNTQNIQSLSQRQLAQKIGYLPQGLPSAAGLSVRELICMGRYPWHGAFGRFTKQDGDIVDKAIEQVGIAHYANQFIDDLSGGERQRAWVAMLLTQQSPVLLLDEPTSALDISHQYELMRLLQQLNRETGQGMIIVLHDINLASRFADHILAMRQGQCFFQGTPAQFMQSERLEAMYGVPMSLIDHPSNDSKVALIC